MALALFAFALATPMARAQSLEPASIETIEAEARVMLDLDGPQPGEKRPVVIWRPRAAAPGPLPTLYMADGADGLYVVAARLHPAIAAGLMPPVQIIGLYPDPARRQQEYIQRGRTRFNAHARWLLETVMPWAEREMGASPTQRAVGGYSNGAAFALFMAADYPQTFIGVLAHSPIATADRFRVDARAAGVRWALSAGWLEGGGYPLGAVTTVRGVANAAGAATRICTGAWRHDPHAWADLSPGAIAWMFNFPNPDAVATALERGACRVSPER